MEKELNGNFVELSMCIDQSGVKKLLDIADPPDQVKLKVLFNAVVKCTKDYNAEPSSVRLKDWQKAEAALKEFSAQLREKYCPGEKSLSNIQAVLTYLHEVGWQVSQSGLYKHRKAGKIASESDGTFRRKAVDKYAKLNLKQKATGKKKQDAEDELRRRELEKKVEKLETENEMAKLNLEIKQGQYFRKDQVFVELAARLGALEAGFKHRMQSKAADLIRLTEGKLEKVGEFISAMNLIYDELINEFAQAREFDVVIAGADEEEVE